MKKTLLMFLIILVCVLNATVFGAATNLKVLKPKLGRTIDISQAAQQRYQKWCELFDQVVKGQIHEDKMTPDQKKLYTEFGDDIGFWETVTGGCSWYCGGGPKRESASSCLPAQNGITYVASNAHDFDLRTAWIEGKQDYGIGEYIEYYFEALSPRITTIKIYNGYYKSEQGWEANSRVKKLKLSINNNPYAILELADCRRLQTFNVEPLQSKVKGRDLVLKFEILEVYSGKQFADVAISEINFDGLDVHCFGKGTLIAMADGTKKPIERLKVGDAIYSYDFKTQKIVKSTVKELSVVTHLNLIELDFGDFTVVSTKDHPYFVAGKGWCSAEPEKTKLYKNMDQVGRLVNGDQIWYLDSRHKLTKVTLKNILYLKAVAETYTIVKLNRNSNFFANGLLVGTEELKKEGL